MPNTSSSVIFGQQPVKSVKPKPTETEKPKPEEKKS